MPPKKTAAVSTDVAAPSTSDAQVDEKDAAVLRKIASHPPAGVMVREALKELDSRKGVSSQAIQNYIKQKYPSVDVVRLKHSVRRALKKGIETGTLVRPASSTNATGAIGKFRIAPKAKETKAKGENTDPNVQKAPKSAKSGDKKSPKSGATKESTKSQEDSKPPKKVKKPEETSTSKAAPKKPKAKKAAVKEDDKGASDSTKKGAKATKEAKAGKASQSKAAKVDDSAPASKATGKRGKKTAE